MDLRIAILPELVETGPDSPSSLQFNEEQIEQLKEMIELTSDIVEPADANTVIWLDAANVDGLMDVLDSNNDVVWVQLPLAGVEKFAAAGLFEHRCRFACAKSAYGQQVGEAALALTLACLRSLVKHARSPQWHRQEPGSLFEKRVTILGAGGIAETLLSLLTPFNCSTTVVRRSAEPLKGAHRTVQTAELDSILPETDVLVLALPLTSETNGIIAARQLNLMPKGSIVVNVARGGHIVTDDLVAALEARHIAAAGLDVTDPEPLPEGHPLWLMDNVIVTSHCADSQEFVARKLMERIEENVENMLHDFPLVGQVDKKAGY